MNRLLLLFVFLSVSFLTVSAQSSVESYRTKGKYFEYTILARSRLAQPLFAEPPRENSDMIYATVEDWHRGWTAFTTDFIDRILKKYLTVEEIRKMIKPNAVRSDANVSLYYDYYGNIIYMKFIYKNEYEHILTDEKLYGIYQDLMNFKIDVTNFEWRVAEVLVTPEQQKKVFCIYTIPFFFKNNCP